MTNEFSGLFTGNNSNHTSGANQLQKTAELTTTAERIANDLLRKLNENPELYKADVAASMKSHDDMDKLISTNYDYPAADYEFLKSESEDTIDKMIRSQQSKRSRSKGKVMTIENYKTMLTGAISENLLRLASGKAKSAGGGNTRGTELGYTAEELEKFAIDQEALKKEIRNVQSKKSIMKAKANFEETDTRWLQLLDDEETLKTLRDGSSPANPEANKALESIDQLRKEFADVDVTNVSNKSAKELLARITELIKN